MGCAQGSLQCFCLLTELSTADRMSPHATQQHGRQHDKGFVNSAGKAPVTSSQLLSHVKVTSTILRNQHYQSIPPRTSPLSLSFVISFVATILLLSFSAHTHRCCLMPGRPTREPATHLHAHALQRCVDLVGGCCALPQQPVLCRTCLVPCWHGTPRYTPSCHVHLHAHKEAHGAIRVCSNRCAAYSSGRHAWPQKRCRL